VRKSGNDVKKPVMCPPVTPWNKGSDRPQRFNCEKKRTTNLGHFASAAQLDFNQRLLPLGRQTGNYAPSIAHLTTPK